MAPREGLVPEVTEGGQGVAGNGGGQHFGGFSAKSLGTLASTPEAEEVDRWGRGEDKKISSVSEDPRKLLWPAPPLPRPPSPLCCLLLLWPARTGHWQAWVAEQPGSKRRPLGCGAEAGGTEARPGKQCQLLDCPPRAQPAPWVSPAQTAACIMHEALFVILCDIRAPPL